MRVFSRKMISAIITVGMMLLICMPSIVVFGAQADSQQYKFTKVDTEVSLCWNGSYFKNGMHLVYKDFGDYYYVTKEGKIVKLHPNIVGVSFSDGLAPIYDKNKGLGYIDTTGQVVIPMTLNALTDSEGEILKTGAFVNGHALVYKGSGYNGNNDYQQDLWYTIDKTGKKVDNVTLLTDTLVAMEGYPYGSEFETVNINGEEVRVFFNEGLALASTNQGADYWVVEKTTDTIPEPVIPEQKPVEEYTNLSILKFTSWQVWDNGRTLNCKITNPTDKVDHGVYAVIICGSGNDTTKWVGETDGKVSRFANSDYYPLEGHIFEYETQPKETIRGYILSEIGGEVGTTEEDLGKGDLKYIVIKLKSEDEKAQLQGEFDSLGLGTYKTFKREENTALQNWLRDNFGLTKGGNNYEEFN